jgi:8-oxo-dGTP pyrophosphatase MutT (NUDIX family)
MESDDDNSKRNKNSKKWCSDELKENHIKQKNLKKKKSFKRVSEIKEQIDELSTVNSYRGNRPIYKTNGVILTDGQKNILIVLEKSGKWGFPKGKMEFQDMNDPKKCAWRECKEELGLDLSSVSHTELCFYKNLNLGMFTVKLENKPQNLQLQKVEIKSVKWINIEELISNFNERPEKFNYSVHLTKNHLSKLNL